MEKIKKKKSSHFHNRFETDFALRILAIIIAVIIWLVLSITQYPTKNKTITNVPVDFSLDSTKADEKGLSVLNYKDLTVDVEIKGMNYEIGNYSASDLVATVNLDEVTKEGTYSLDINVKSAHATDKVSIISVTPETVDLTFERMKSDTFDIKAEAPFVAASDGLTLKEKTVTPSQVEVEAAENDLKQVERVVAKISNSLTISEDKTISTERVVFYDADDNVLDSSKYTIKSKKTFDVNFVVYKKKTAKFSVDFTDCPPGFDVDSLPYEFSEEFIQVISPNLSDSDNENLKLGTISLNDVDLEKTFSFNVDKALASGEVNQTGIDKVDVDFNSAGYTSKTFTIPEKQIKLKNTPSGKKAELETKQLSSVVIYGPEDVLKNLSESDLTAVVDLSDISNIGSASHAVTIYAPKYNSVWCYGDNEVQLQITNSK